MVILHSYVKLPGRVNGMIFPGFDEENGERSSGVVNGVGRQPSPGLSWGIHIRKTYGEAVGATGNEFQKTTSDGTGEFLFSIPNCSSLSEVIEITGWTIRIFMCAFGINQMWFDATVVYQGNSTISMAIFNSYVSLPEGKELDFGVQTQLWS